MIILREEYYFIMQNPEDRLHNLVESTADREKRRQVQEKKLIEAVREFVGRVGEGSQERQGIVVRDYFVTCNYKPRFEQNDTIIIKIGNKEYVSKPYLFWIINQLTIIPLASPINSPVDICDTPNQQSNAFLLFQGQEGIKTVALIIKQGKAKYKFIKNTINIFELPKGCPVMALVNEIPVIYCLKDKNQFQQKLNQSKFENWTFKNNLSNAQFNKAIQLQNEIISLKKELHIRELALKGEDNPGSNVSNQSFIFSNGLSSQRLSQQPIPEEILKIIKENRDKIRQQLKSLKTLRAQCKNLESSLNFKLAQFYRENGIKFHPTLDDLLSAEGILSESCISLSTESSKSTETRNAQLYKGLYNLDSVSRKFQLFDKEIPPLPQFLDSYFNTFAIRAMITMKYIASWKNAKHILQPRYISEWRVKDFSYETVMCECGCKYSSQSQRARKHAQNMFDRAVEQPYKFIVAVLDAIKQMEEHFIIHNDIQFRNFIYYNDDFLLGDFDFSCFVKFTEVAWGDSDIEKQLFDKNRLLMQLHSLINQKSISIDPFFRYSDDHCFDINASPQSNFNVLKKDMPISHQIQFMARLQDIRNRLLEKQNIDPLRDVLDRWNQSKEQKKAPFQIYIDIINWATDQIKRFQSFF